MPTPLPNGTLINQQFEILEMIAEGGYGILYRVKDLKAQRLCALKANTENDPASRAQFEREAQILRGLHQAHLPQYYGYFQDQQGQQYLVMEFIEGANLDVLVERAQGPLSEAQVVTWMIQIGEALHHIHTHSIIHRDVKPQNIIIQPAGKAFLVDFGIAKVYDPNHPTTTGARGVTPGYSPLEQYDIGKTDARSDVYALGATLYRAVTGNVPPTSVQRSAGTPLLLPRQLNPDLSSDIEQIILKAMALEPANRYPTMQTMLQELRALTTGLSTTLAGVISRIRQLPPVLTRYGYQRYAFLLYDDQAKRWVQCTLEGYLRPLTLLNQTRVLASGILRGDQFQVQKLTDPVNRETWTRKNAASAWDRFWSML